MTSIMVQLSDDVERKLRLKAGQRGQSLEAYLQQLAENAVGNGTLRPVPSAEEVERLLDEFSAVPTGKVLPTDFSRADIYDDHD